MTIDQKAAQNAVCQALLNAFPLDDKAADNYAAVAVKAIAALPASDHAGLVERLRARRSANLSWWPDEVLTALDAEHKLALEAATALSAGVTPDRVSFDAGWAAAKEFFTKKGVPAGVRATVGDYKKSDGTYDYFVMLTAGGREMSLHRHLIRGRAEYEAAEINAMIDGTERPSFDDFDVDGPAALSDAPVEGESSIGVPADHPSVDGARVACMSPEEYAAMIEAQRQSFVRAMAPCEHGIRDFEDCPDCRRLAIEAHNERVGK